MVKFFVVKSIHLSSNFRFDVGVVYLRLIIFLVVGDVTIDSDVLLTNFVNLKIKSVQSFRVVHRNRVYVHIFIGVSNHTYINIYIYTM
jgi:hypothetical protein